MRKKSKKHNRARIVLRLPDLDHSKTSVLNSLSSPRSRRNYRFAMVLAAVDPATHFTVMPPPSAKLCRH